MLEGSEPTFGERAAKISAAKQFKTSAEDLALCDICAEGDWEDDNKILFCDACDVCVHQDCYGAGAKKVPSGPWFCDACNHGRRTAGKQQTRVTAAETECVLCPNKGGALKRTSDARWAHIVCALWTPGAEFLDPDGLDVVHPCAVNPARLELTCSICNTKGGACIQCKAPRCLAAFHASCARRSSNVHMVEKEKEDGYVDLHLFCEKHRPAEAGGKKRRRKRESRW